MKLSETPQYQSILAALARLDQTVTNEPEEFAKDWLEQIDTELWDVLDGVEELVI